MNTKDLKSGDKIGILTRGKMSRVVIKTIDKVTPSGQVVIGKKRFNNNGQQTGVDPLIAQYLISVEEAEKIIEQWLFLEKEEEAKRDARSKTPQGIAEKATIAALSVLNQHGYYADVDGDWDLMVDDMERSLTSYMNKHKPIE